jgi:Tol biopolymer transport system component
VGEGYPGLIAYARETEAGFDICTVAPDGTGMEVLTELFGAASAPTWSPDSRFLIYAAGQPDGTERDVYRLEVSTGEVENLTADCGVWDSAPAWSPDSQAILFTNIDESGTWLHVASIDGLESHVLYQAEWGVFGDWSR